MAGSDHLRVQLRSSVSEVRPGSDFWVGIQLDHAPHWHTYWRNPGDSGLATSVDWDVPHGFDVGPMQWPYPQWIETQGQVTFGYEGKAILLARVTVPEQGAAPGSEVRLAAEVSWLECKDVCIPGQASVSLRLPVRADQGEPSSTGENPLASALRRLPAPVEDWDAQATISGQRLFIVMTPPAGSALPPPAAITFFPEDEYLFLYADGFPVAGGAERLTLEAALDPARTGLPDKLGAVLVSDEGWGESSEGKAIRLTIPVQAEAAPAAGGSAAGAPIGAWRALLIAFLGGVILNAMPCVFPVISLKILSFVQLADSDPRKVWRHGVWFAAGVLASFWVLAGVLLAVKAVSPSVGWGFQLSQPGFVVAMGVLFLLLSLNLFGVFEIGASLAGWGAQWTGHSGYAGTFLSGVLATVVATPCTGPFMGAAVGFALTQPAALAMAVFTSLGAGMAAPYLLLTRFPAWLRWLPRPGPWMESLKQVMGFFLLAFVFYLTWLYAELRGTGGLSRLLTGFLLAAFGAWMFGRWGSMTSSGGRRAAAGAAALALVVWGGVFAASEPTEYGWREYSEELVSSLKADGKPFFIDFTASWCVTCQSNKRLVLNTEDVQQAFREKGVTLIRADWSDQSESITRALAAYGRQGVPLYLLYGAHPGASPMILPELLTKGMVLDALTKLP